jgi:hypothetical protein
MGLTTLWEKANLLLEYHLITVIIFFYHLITPFSSIGREREEKGKIMGRVI